MNTAITSDRARFPVVRLYNADIYNYIYIYDCYNNCNVILLHVYTLFSIVL